MNKSLIVCKSFFALSAVAVFVICASSVVAQDLGRPRSITSDDFVKQRPAGKKAETGGAKSSTPSTGSKNTASSRRTRRPGSRVATTRYRLGKSERVSRRPAQNKSVVRLAGKDISVSEVGVTMWKLRPPVMGEEGHRFPVSISGSREYWLAERAGAQTRFDAGDKVRIAIESSSEGYLYVVNSEYYADGSYGAPTIIFPASENDNNFVVPGQLVDIPDQSEDFPYFLITPKKPGYLGESLTVIVSPVRLLGLRTGAGGSIENIEELVTLEAKADFDVYLRTDNGDKLFSETEADSACGARTRQLVRADAGASACGAKTRQLTRDEAKPQTIYRVRAEKLQAAVAFVKIRVGR